jgi:alkanesulfonate monooxygenase SsuD/methylene tetrahydromethanopterin reductase-like flavin-dependent oxidoreductase (luciferase family)
MSVSFKTGTASRGTLLAGSAQRGGIDMRIGIGLPAAIPGVDGGVIGQWAVAAEDHGFESVGVIDRLVYDNLDPLVALAAAAARTSRVELLTTVLNVPWRRNAVVLAKQLASVDRLAGGRLTAGLGLGGWPADHTAVERSPLPAGALMDQALATMARVWDSDDIGPAARPRLLVGGFAPAAFERAARYGDGWVAPSFGFDACAAGIASVRAAWAGAGRAGRPRVVVERYVCLGDGADASADRCLHHYYGDAYFDAVRADTPTTVDHLEREIVRLADAGCDDLVLLPCDGDLRQVEWIANAAGVVSAETTRVPA